MNRLPAVLVLLTGLAGCGGDEESKTDKAGDGTSPKSAQPVVSSSRATPEDTFKAFQQATQKNDWKTALECMTDESQTTLVTMISIPLGFMAAFDKSKEEEIKDLLKQHNVDLENSDPSEIADKAGYIANVMAFLEKSDGASAGMLVTDSATLGPVKFEGDIAQATVTRKDDAGEMTQDVEFHKVGDNWLLHFKVESPQLAGSESGAEFDISEFATYDQQDDLPPQPPQAVSLEEYNQAWHVDLDRTEQPAGELLALLASELGLEFKPSPDAAEHLESPVSLKVTGVSRFEVVEQICQQADVTPVYSPKSLTVSTKSRTWPVVFAGPFLIEVTNVKTVTKYGTGSLEMRAFATGLPPSVIARLNEDGALKAVNVLQVKSADGSSLKQSANGGGFFMNNRGPVFNHRVTTGLRGLIRSIEAIDLVTGRARLTLTTGVESARFDDLKTGVEKTAGGVKLKLASVSGGEVQIEFEGAETKDVKLLAYDAAGKIQEPNFTGSSGFGGKGSFHYSYQTLPARIDAWVVTSSEDLSYDFRLKGIAIPDFAQMPESIAAVEYEGDSPLLLEFVRLHGDTNNRKAVFKAKNQTNKDVTSMSLQMEYLDAGGKVLKDFPVSQGIAKLPAGESREIEVTAFFAPDETKSVRARVDLLQFADASDWDIHANPSPKQVPYVVGEAKLNMTGEAELRAGYVGLDESGKVQVGMAGVGRVEPGSFLGSATSTTNKPRITHLKMVDSTRCRFSHMVMIPGKYLVYVRRGDRNTAWQWVEVTTNAKLRLNLAIDDDQTGDLEVSVGDDVTGTIEVVPLSEDGTSLIGDADLPRSRIGYWLGTSLKPENGKAVFAGLSPGRYRVLAGGEVKDVAINAGETASVELQ